MWSQNYDDQCFSDNGCGVSCSCFNIFWTLFDEYRFFCSAWNDFQIGEVTASYVVILLSVITSLELSVQGQINQNQLVEHFIAFHCVVFIYMTHRREMFSLYHFTNCSHANFYSTFIWVCAHFIHKLNISGRCSNIAFPSTLISQRYRVYFCHCQSQCSHDWESKTKKRVHHIPS